MVIETFLSQLKAEKPGIYARLMELVEDRKIPLKSIAHELHILLKMDEGALLSLLKKLSVQENWRPKTIVKVDADGKEVNPRSKKAMFELTDSDVQLLDDLRSGKVGFEKAQRELAVRAFAKILADPGSVQVRDWLQSEMVLLKKDEITQKKESMEKAMGRMFAGLVIDVCPHCGKPIYDIQDGEIVQDKEQDEIERPHSDDEVEAALAEI